jgi:hypothetical protein
MTSTGKGDTMSRMFQPADLTPAEAAAARGATPGTATTNGLTSAQAEAASYGLFLEARPAVAPVTSVAAPADKRTAMAAD